jgi:hypothetical protein
MNKARSTSALFLTRKSRSRRIDRNLFRCRWVVTPLCLTLSCNTPSLVATHSTIWVNNLTTRIMLLLVTLTLVSVIKVNLTMSLILLCLSELVNKLYRCLKNISHPHLETMRVTRLLLTPLQQSLTEMAISHVWTTLSESSINLTGVRLLIYLSLARSQKNY